MSRARRSASADCRRPAVSLAADTAGVAAIEFALTAPLLLLFLLGSFAIAWWAWSAAELRLTTSATARCMIVDPATCGSSTAASAFAAAQSQVFKAPKLSFSGDSCGMLIEAARIERSPFVPLLPRPVIRARACAGW